MLCVWWCIILSYTNAVFGALCACHVLQSNLRVDDDTDRCPNDTVSKVGRRRAPLSPDTIIIIRLVGSTRNVNTDCETTVARIGRHLVFFNTSTPFYCYRFFKLSTLNSRHNARTIIITLHHVCVCNICHTRE